MRSQELLLSFADDEILADSSHSTSSKTSSTSAVQPKKKVKKKKQKRPKGIDIRSADDGAEALCHARGDRRVHAGELQDGGVPATDRTEVVDIIRDTAESRLRHDTEADDDPNDVCVDLDQFFDTFSLFRTMEISLAHFALQDLDGLSMSQLEMLQDAHMQAFTVLNDKKVSFDCTLHSFASCEIFP
ncbi:hypothetical protein DYB32_001937 [Aphanomyces invadans]|uniref:Uncharacterized protein n=1 Tax=Aphanomyces invadans TaxID=157072 RepID=A0A418B4I4_9STRA|nr:hypothetical protein DYB32_001937 [Aphanomyces invadans]